MIFLFSCSKTISIRSHIETTPKQRSDKNNNSNSLRCQRGDGWSASNGTVIDVQKRGTRARARVCDITLLYYVAVWLLMLNFIKHFLAQIEKQQERTESNRALDIQYTHSNLYRSWKSDMMFELFLFIFDICRSFCGCYYFEKRLRQFDRLILRLDRWEMNVLLFFQFYTVCMTAASNIGFVWFPGLFLTIQNGNWLTTLQCCIVCNAYWSAHFHWSRCQPFNPVWFVNAQSTAQILVYNDMPSTSFLSAQLHELKAKTFSVCTLIENNRHETSIELCVNKTKPRESAYCLWSAIIL